MSKKKKPTADVTFPNTRWARLWNKMSMWFDSLKPRPKEKKDGSGS